MKKFLLLFTDVFALYLALFATLFARYYNIDFQAQIGFHFLPFSILFIIWLFVFYMANFYEPAFWKNGPEFYATFFKTIIINSTVGLAFFYLIPYFVITPKRNLFIFLVIFSILDFLARTLFNHILTTSAKLKKPTIIVGLNDQSTELAKYLKNNPQLGYQLVYIADISGNQPTANEELLDFGILKNIDQLEHAAKDFRVNTIIISPDAYKIRGMIETFYKLLHQKINFYNLSNFYEMVSHKILLGSVDQAWFLENLSEGTKRSYETAKRFFDFIFAVVFGVIALILFPFISAGIKLSSRGPILFKQSRIGQMGKQFEIIKFRTMVADAEKETGAVWAQENDPRVTKFGKFLRKTRLDELPQLWNILKGEMSFVGPRAERPEFHEKLKKEIPFYEERYLTKPGLTGWAQIQYHYGASVKDAAEKLQYDLFYIKHRSLTLDLSVILKTANIVLRQSGR